MEEAEDKFGSKAKANAGLTLGIIGTALSCLGGLGGVAGGAPLGQNFSGITEQYYQGQISNIREIYDMYKILDNKIVDSSFALYKNQRDEKDALSDRIARLETKQAVADAVEPWRNQVLQMQIAGETANRQFAELTLVNYMNNMFYPVSTTNITLGTTSTAKSTYNPLLITPIAPSITI